MSTKIRLLIACTIIAIIAGCGTAKIKPNYTSTNPEELRIGGEKPEDKSSDVNNMGSYCLQVVDQWKADGETPDGQAIWSKDTLRKVVPCR